MCVCRRIKQQVDQVHTNLLCVPGSREHSQRPPNVASTTSAAADSNGAIYACQQSCRTRFTLPSTTLLCLPSQPNSQKKATAFQSAASTMPAADVNNGPTNKLTKFTPTCCVFQVRGNTHSSLQRHDVCCRHHQWCNPLEPAVVLHELHQDDDNNKAVPSSRFKISEDDSVRQRSIHSIPDACYCLFAYHCYGLQGHGAHIAFPNVASLQGKTPSIPVPRQNPIVPKDKGKKQIWGSVGGGREEEKQLSCLAAAEVLRDNERPSSPPES